MNAPHILVGVTASVSAYQAADLVRRLRERGAEVTCMLTKEAAQFITPLTLQAVSERQVYTELFALGEPAIVHTTLADAADALVIAPATAHMIAKLAHGLADDVLSCVALATTAPVVVAPAMNVHMYEHPATQDNIKRLKAFGHRFVGPVSGRLACGYDAIGHVASVDAIADAAFAALRPSSRRRNSSHARKP